ncbi:hypothetical protein JYU34_001378 [Plutella xylostella]|uniref:Uncharacterized protein n=1 Tax=Plutella xylostella TaxID=51655 RepID=A0ABQ7R3U5_PLUXY|nr:hypothetical protein JYU34_001378 [Plutella xylostella]
MVMFRKFVLSSVREELAGEDKWKQKRNLSFDQNRQILEVTKERDEFKLVAVTLQRAVAQLLAYCACAENELNQTVLAQLLQPVLPSAAPPCPPLDGSLQARRVHFAPDLGPLLAELDEDDLVGYLQQQRDLSLEIKLELENSLRRLRHEARELLALSAGGRHQLSVTQSEHSMLELECSELNITGLVEEMDARRGCDHCRQHRKSLEEATAESLQREKLLRADLEAAMMKIAQLMTDRHGDDVIAEGYGLAQQLSHPLSLPARPSPRTPPCPPEELSPRGKLWGDIEQLQREKEDLEQQLESANRQLRSTRKFVEEQALERESERDEFASRLAELTNENAALTQRLQNNARILNEVEQLEAQTREMNQIINEMENKKSSTEEELKATNEKISILRDIIATLENQLEQKTTHETEILEQLEEMRRTIDERDSKMRALVGELESLRSERVDSSNVTCDKCCEGSQDVSELMDTVKEQVPSPAPLPQPLSELQPVFTALEALARAEDMALRRVADLEMQRALLKDVAQEVRAERDVLQARMSEQALKISSLAARLELQRHNAEALAHDATSQLSVQLHDSLAESLLLEPYWRMVSEQALKISSLAARLELQRHNAEALAHDATSQLSVQLHDSLAEVQRLKEELDTKDKQLARLRQSAGERDGSEKDDSTHGDSCNTKDKITILERELSSAQSRLAQMTSVVQGLETDREILTRRLKDAHRVIAEKEAQVDELMALKLDDDDMQKSEQKSEVIEGKTSARTLSDIVSISDFDEQDLQMRRAELRQNTSLNAPYVTETRDKMANRTLPPDVQRANMSSLNIDFTDHFELGHFTPRADSLPLQFTSTQTKDRIKNFKRNINETTIFGTADRFGDSVKHSTAVNIPDNCSMYPNRDVNDSKGHSVDPKKIDFSLEPSQDNKTNDENEFTSLRELGIVLDIKQENFPDILSQLKHEIKKSKSELDVCKTELKYAEEQLCEFPALKEEVEELKGLLENTMATMETDKKFYENQLDQFSTNKKNMEQRLTELSQEVNDKSKDLHLLKEDILRRENMILELAKEKRNLTNKMTELEVKIDELQSRNTALEKFEFENHQLRDKVAELQKLQQLVSEKNQQIDSLNQHLDRLDDLQRNLIDKTEEFESLKEAFEEKSNELFQMQDTVEALNRDLANVHEDNNKLNLSNKELKLKLTKLEKEQENQSLKLQSHETELERVNSLNTELTSKIEELKHLTDKLKDKETEIEILNEDINSYHEEIASLKEQLKMVSRSPSPKSKNEEERSRDRQASNDKKQLVKIRKQISLLQHELDFNKKELNDKAFELAKARLDVTELKSTLSQESKLLAERDQENRRLGEAERTLRQEVEALTREKQGLGEQLELVMCRIREESNIDELKQKLQEKTEQCEVLERELIDMRDKLERMRSPPHEDSCALVVSGTRSPTAELERALRDQLDYSRRLDVDIMEQASLLVRVQTRVTAELERALRDQLDYSRRLDVDIMEQASLVIMYS